MAGSNAMPTVEFAPALTRHVPCPPQQVPAGTVASALAAAFQAAPALRGYVLDEQGAVRKHVAVFVNGEMVRRDVVLERGVAGADRVMVIQALTGG
jgi:sulfur carrier protein ThiS